MWGLRSWVRDGKTIMFPRMPKVLRLLTFSCVYMYCLFLLFHYHQMDKQNSVPKAPLQKSMLVARGFYVRDKCASDPPPRQKTETQVHLAAQVSPQLTEFYQRLHLKGVFDFVFFFPRGNFTWCLVPKVASSSMSKALLDIEGIRRPEDDPTVPYQIILRKSWSKTVQAERENKTLSAAVKFLFVRHPFQRIVSAYRNKLEDSYRYSDGEFFYKTYGWNIVQKFGWRRGKNKVAAVAERRNGDSEKVEMNSLDAAAAAAAAKEEEEKREPTFVEFVEYLLNTNPEEYDEHWKPITMICQVCHYTYDYILKYENFKEEIDLLVKVLQKDGHLPKDFRVGWENREDTGGEVDKQYLGQIGEDKLRQLYKKYYYDFLYFDYAMDGYI